MINREAFNFAPCVCSGFICSFLSGSKRSEPSVEQVNITPATENYLQHNDKKGPRIDSAHQAFLCPRVILYENCNMRLSSFLYWQWNKAQLLRWRRRRVTHTLVHTSPERDEHKRITKLLHFNTGCFSDWYLIQMYLFSRIKICHQGFVLLSVRCLRDYS